MNVTALKAMVNSVPLHGLPVSLNLMNNAMLKYYNLTTSITTINHPFQRENAITFEDIVNPLQAFNPDSFFNSLAFVIGLSLFASAFLLFPLVERITNAKQVQLMTGMYFLKSNLSIIEYVFLKVCLKIANKIRS